MRSVRTREQATSRVLSHALAFACTLAYSVCMGPFGELPDVSGVDDAPDQVVRLKEYRAAHPEWNIWCDRVRHIWHAERMTEGGRDKVTRYGLRFLLDALERG